MPAHFRFAPSGFSRLMQGAGCWHLNGSFPETCDPEASEEGTAAHQVAFDLAMGRVHKVGDLLSNGVACTRQMPEGALEYVGYIRETVGAGHAAHVRYEEQIRIPCLHLTDCGGTPDARYYNPETCILDVFDYKFGHAKHDPFEHWQLIGYAAGILQLPEITGPVILVRMHIIQPRCYSAGGITRSWTMTPDQLAPYIARLKRQIERADAGEADTATGDECSTCNAAHACSTLQQSAMKSVDVAGKALPLVMDPASVGVELRAMRAAIERLEARASGLEAQGLSYLRDGKIVPGWAMRHGEGRERWSVGADTVRAFGVAFGVDLMRPPEPITPNQARTALTGKTDPAVVSAMTEHPRGEAKMVIEDAGTARRIFARIGG